ncbi:MAG: ABC transporter [Clostridiaceae bacterium BRH_c20a]|nr:MAG: ABC transporter [Clostridiaceae bacterium BRH_c20a]
MKALEIKNISKSYGGLDVLINVYFTLEQGERRAIIGPNGAGKTSLFNIISGIIKPDSGEIYLLGQNVTRLSTYLRSRLGLARTFQRNTLFNNLSILDNVELALHSTKSDSNIKDILRNWGLWDKRKVIVKELSYGEQRQIEILLALVQSPKIIILDEPTAGMSPMETKTITEMIKSLSRDITVLIIEHDMDVVFNLADGISVLHNGQILCEGSPDEIKSNPLVKEVYLGTDH